MILVSFSLTFRLFCLTPCHHCFCARRKHLAAMQWIQAENWPKLKLTQWNYSYYPYLYSNPVHCVAHLCQNARQHGSWCGSPRLCLIQLKGYRSAFPLCWTTSVGIPGNLSSLGKWRNKTNSQCRMRKKPQTFPGQENNFPASSTLRQIEYFGKFYF